MSVPIQKLIYDYGLPILFLIVVFFIFRYFYNKGSWGSESNQTMQTQYKNREYSAGVAASNPDGQNEVFASATGMETSMPGLPASCSGTSISNPSELLPKILITNGLN
jgi:hypothetical protein